MPLEVVHQAAVRFPPAAPSERHVSDATRTSIWPVGKRPFGLPNSCTRKSLAATPDVAGHGWFGRHVSSISRAATPASRTRGPSAHQIGPSPSHTAVGVQVNVTPARTISAAKRVASISCRPAYSPISSHPQLHRAALALPSHLRRRKPALQTKMSSG